MTPRPLISVVVPCYKQAHYLADAIDSLVAQSVENWECIIVNDGSPDDTRTVGEALARKDARVRYVEQDNKGPGAARNRGIEQAKGQFIQFLDADDLLLPDKFRRVLEAAPADGSPSLVVNDFWLMDEAGNRFESAICMPEFVFDDPLHDISLRWETELSIPPNAMLFDARLFASTGQRFDETLANHEDWECWMRVLKLRPAICRVREKLSVYRVHRASLTRDEERNYVGFRVAIDREIARSKHDVVLHRMLRFKRRMTDDFYGKGWRPGIVSMLRRPGKLSRSLPSQVRNWLLRRLDLMNLRAHGWKAKDEH